MPGFPPIPRELAAGPLRLVAPAPGYAAGLHAAKLASLPELRRWMPWAQRQPDLAEDRALLERAAQAFGAGEDLMYLMLRGEAVVGGTGLHRLDWSVPKGEIGYWVATPHTGRGYARAAAQALCELALRPPEQGGLGFARLEIRCDPENARSRRIPEGLGFALDARLVNDGRSADGSGLRDTLVFSRLGA